MSKIFKKENVMPVVVLSVICLIVAALLGVVNSITAPIIKKAEEQKVYDSLRVVIDGDFAPVDPMPEGVADTVTAMYKVTDGDNLVGHAVTVSVKGYAGEILMTVGVDAEGKVTKVVVTKQSESHGKSGMDSYPDNFADVAADDVASVELFSGATISSTAIRKGVTDAVNAATGVAAEPEVDLAMGDAEIRAVIAEMSEGVELEEIPLEDTTYVRRVYRDKNGLGYFVQLLVVSEHYGTVETETVVHIDIKGAVKNIKKLSWNVSDAAPDWGYNPPDEERVNQLYNDFIDKDINDIVDVDLETGATNTSTNLANSVKEAIETVNKLILLDMPTEESEIIAMAEELLGVGAGALVDVTPDEKTYIKRVYKDSTGTNYAVYTVVISQYGTPETETLIHVSNTGVIKGVKKITWKVSNAAPDWGYNPPDEERVNQLFGDFVGKDIEGVDEVDLTTGATNTATNLATAMKEAINAVKQLAYIDMPTDESTVISYIKELLGDGCELEEIALSASEYVRRVYRDKNGSGFVAYVVVMSQYGYPESETLVHMSSSGKLEEIKKITWKTSDAIYGYVPPTEETVNAFYERLNSTVNIDEVELVTNATNTSGNVVKSVKEACDIIKELAPEYQEESYTARIVGILVLSLALVGSVVAVIVSKKKRGGKNG